MRDFNDLYFFAAVVTHRGFSAAARALGVPKSRISRRVAVLEEQLGVRLLARSTRRFGVTEIGEEIYRHARAAVVEAESIDEVAMRMQSEPRGLVRLGCPIALRAVLSEALPAFLGKHPSLRVQVLFTNRRLDLIEESVDVAVRVRDQLDTDADLQMKRMGTARRIFVASDEFVKKYGRPTLPAELTDMPTLHDNERVGAASWILTGPEGQTTTVEVEPRLSAGDFGVLFNAAIAGMGVALLPKVDCLKAIDSGRLVQVLPDWSAPDGIVHAVFTSRRGMLPSVRAIIDFLADTLRHCDLG